MKRKITISGKKVVSSCMVFAMMCQLVGSNNMIIANAENETDAETKTYIVMADSSKEYDDVTSRAAYSISEEDPELADNNIAVMELTPEEAEAMQQNNDDLIVEEDIIISANSLEEEVITEEAETVLTESEYESQIVTEETVGIEETEISEKSTGSTETIESTEYLTTEEFEETETVSADWNLQAINADEININATSIQKVKVALLDSGVDTVNGIELADWTNMVEDEDYVLPVYQDLTGHGTGIASIICANGEGGIKGVNPNVDLYSVKVLDGENKAPLSRIIKGIYWCIDNDVNIINMSFGTSTYSNAMKKAVEDAYDAGILMVGASGNNADKVEYPAAFKEVMAVAATNPEAEISSFSNTGEELDIAAPGEKIKTSSFFGGSVVTHGTSIAVPHVVGVASLLWEKDLSKSHEFIRQLIDATSKNISNSEACGLIDADYAMSMYDTFAKEYNDSHAEKGGIIPENIAPPETFEKINEDEAYVEGRWGWTNHDILVDKNVIFAFGDPSFIKVVKAGAVYPDLDTALITGFGAFPEFHGGYRIQKEGKSDVEVNYVACYEFLTRIALKGGDTSGFTDYTLVKGLNKQVFNKIKSSISTTHFGAFTWDKILAPYGNTKTNRKYFLYGAAIHLITDSFAHNTWFKNGGKEGNYISHSKGADDPGTCPSRFEISAIAAAITVECLGNGKKGNFKSFTEPLRLAYDNTFLKKRIYKYVIANAGSEEAVAKEIDLKFLKNTSN